MGFGITGFVKPATRKALIRWFNPDEIEKKNVYDNTIQENVSNTRKFADNAKQYITMAIVGNLNANEIVPDVRKAEAHRYQSEVTEYAVEDGSILVQHIVQKPITVSLQFEETNSGKMIRSAMSYLGSESVKNTTMFDQLVEIWERKIPVSIITEQKEYKNMVVKNMPIMHKSPYKGALQVMVDFIQLSVAQIQLVNYKGATTSISKAASPKIDGGQQTTQSISLNEFNDMFN